VKRDRVKSLDDSQNFEVRDIERIDKICYLAEAYDHKKIDWILEEDQ